MVFPPGVLPATISAYEYGGGLAIGQDGILYEWFGVTDPVATQVLFPAPVTQVLAVSRREAHSLALTNDGVYAWGLNHKGQLGDGTTVSRSDPQKVLFPPEVTQVTAVAAGYVHSLALTNNGVYAWGDNFNGELGDGTRINRTLPVRASIPSGFMISRIAAGRNDSFAVTDGGIFSWGSDFAGQLGNGSFGILPDGSSDVGQTLPVRVVFSRRANVFAITDIAAGEYYTLALTNDGLYAWGMNLSGDLGTGTGTIAIPARVQFPKKVTTVLAIAACTNHTAAITNDGLYAWGNNAANQLGTSNKTSQLFPTRVPGQDKAVGIALAEYTSISLH